MRVRWLGWAGLEVEAAGETLIIDALEDPGALYAPLGDLARRVDLPTVVAPSSKRSAAAGLVTHLHRDHADAGALGEALAPGSPVLGPPPAGGEKRENAGLAQATAELSEAGLPVEAMEPWAARDIGPFRIIALPAVDGLGDPQVSWLIEAEGQRVLHLGDTLFHGFWWRIAQRHGPFDAVFAPINGAVVSFPHRHPASPLPAVMDPEQAAIAADALTTRTVVPIHYGGYELEPYYRPVPDEAERFMKAATGRSYTARPLAVGEALDIVDAIIAAAAP
ncbi:MAG: MBL fold metallo-hydrolase [Solirubrobacteraceae bacterium]